MTTLHYYVWILATLLLGTRVSARKVLQQEQGGVGVTALDLAGKDLADFVSSAIVKSERALAKQKGLLAQFSGEGTAYSAPVKDATGFACSRREIPEKAKRNFVAINNNQWKYVCLLYTLFYACNGYGNPSMHGSLLRTYLTNYPSS